MSPHCNRIDRRRFLVGASGAVLALPMLEFFAPRRASGAPATPPKRLLLLFHQNGRVVGNGQQSGGVLNDLWSPRTTTGPLPTTGALSPLLAPLEAIRNEVVTVDGVDNLVRHCTSPSIDQGHSAVQLTSLTCRTPTGTQATGPSFDFFLGNRLRASAAMPSSMVMLGTAGPDGQPWIMNNTAVFFGANGTPPTIVNPDPHAAIPELFGASAKGVMRSPKPAPAPAPLPPTTAPQLLATTRGSVLDGVLDSFNALRGRVNSADRARLDAHAEYVRNLELAYSSGGGGTGSGGGTGAGGGIGAGGGAGAGGGGAGGGSGGGGGVVVNACQRPDDTKVPPNSNGYTRGEMDAQLMPAIIENAVQALACDLTRSVALFFWNGYDAQFPTEFSGTSPFIQANWHGTIHETQSITAGGAANLRSSFQLYSKTFTALVQRLASLQEVDGSRMLDNTLVVWVSEMGYGAAHTAYNVPVVLAGMKSGFAQGQGRHVVANRRSLGDLFAQILRMYGGTDTTYGDTGTIGSHGSGTLFESAGYPGFITAGTNLHQGSLDL